MTKKLRFFHTLSLRIKLNVLAVILLIVFATCMFFVLNSQLKEAAEKGALEKVYSDLALGYEYIDMKYPGDWRVEGDILYKGDVKINENYEIVDEIAEMTGGTVTIFLGDTRVTTNVMNNGERAVGTKVSDEVAKVIFEDQENFYGEANVVGNLYQTGYQPIKNKNGEIIGIWYVGAPQNFIDETARDGLVKTSWMIIAGTIVVTIFMMWYTGRLTRRLQRINETMARAGQGDFTHTLKDLGGDEIGKLADAYNEMTNRLRKLIEQVKTTGNQVNDASKLMASNAEETSKASDQIANVVQEITVGSEEQVNKSIETANAVNNIAILMTNTKESIQNTSLNANESAKAAIDGRQIMKDASEQMGALAEQNKEIYSVIQQLREKSLEINQILTLISDVADQTNLLALNAAIEAARAGEQGKGFAVVADEVRKLAEQTTQSSQQVSQLIEEVQAETEAAVQAIEIGEDTTKRGEQLVLRADEAFGELAQSFNNISSELSELVDGVEKAAKETDELVKAVEDVREISEDTSDHLQTVAASVEEQNASMQEMASNSEQLEEIATKLKEAVNVFKV